MSAAEILKRWIAPLSQRLGRSESEIETRGLSAYDFSPSQEVEIEFDTGDYMRFKYAFVLVDQDRELVAVFTEHAGYHEFDFRSVRVTQLNCDVYVGEDFR